MSLKSHTGQLGFPAQIAARLRAAQNGMQKKNTRREVRSIPYITPIVLGKSLLCGAIP